MSITQLFHKLQQLDEQYSQHKADILNELKSAIDQKPTRPSYDEVVSMYKMAHIQRIKTDSKRAESIADALSMPKKAVQAILLGTGTITRKKRVNRTMEGFKVRNELCSALDKAVYLCVDRRMHLVNAAELISSEATEIKGEPYRITDQGLRLWLTELGYTIVNCHVTAEDRQKELSLPDDSPSGDQFSFFKE